MLTIANVSKRFETGTVALERIDCTVEPGELVALVGTTGCGKSTLLRLVGGLERPSAGRIVIDGRPVEGPRPEVGFIFQEPRLMPWLDVESNVVFGLGHLPRDERHARPGAWRGYAKRAGNCRTSPSASISDMWRISRSTRS